MLPRKNETMPRPCAAPPRHTLAAALVAAAAVLSACAQAQPAGSDAGPPGMRMERGMGMRHPGMEGRGEMHPGMGGAGMFMGQPEWVARRVDRMLDGVGASDAQRAQIRQIAQTAAADLMAQRDAGRGLRAQGLQLFTAPSVDAAAAESLRQQMLAQHDQASRRMLQAMLDTANVLTPEQRMKLAERNRQRAEQMRNRMREMRDHAPRTPPGNG